MATTSTVLVSQGQALLVDPAWLPDELDALAIALEQRGLTVIGGFATHAHHDHLLWHPRFGNAARWSSEATARLAASERPSLTQALGPEFPPHLVDLMGRVRGTGVEIPNAAAPPGIEIELLTHNGHAPGHTALWLPAQRVLIAGDMLSDIELPLPFDPDDVPSYLDGLDLLATVVDEASVVIPGHGTVGVDARARLDADRRYIDDMLARGASDDPRVHNPGMAEEHAHMVRLVKRSA